MRWLLIPLLLLSGCDAFDPPAAQVPKHTQFSFELRIEPQLSSDGLAISDGKSCVVFLKEYPTCLQHEVRHCVEGNWHGNELNGDDCF